MANRRKIPSNSTSNQEENVYQKGIIRPLAKICLYSKLEVTVLEGSDNGT